MGLISRVSSRTYRFFTKPTVPDSRLAHSSVIILSTFHKQKTTPKQNKKQDAFRQRQATKGRQEARRQEPPAKYAGPRRHHGLNRAASARSRSRKSQEYG